MKNYNLVQLLTEQFKKHSEKAILKIYKNKNWIEYSGKKCLDIIDKVGKSLLNEGAKKGDNIGIFSQNMPEWTLADIGAQSIGCPVIPIYATNVADQVKYILDDAKIEYLFVGEKEQYKEVLDVLNETDIPLKKIIVFDDTLKLENEQSIYFNDWISQELPESLAQQKEELYNDIDDEDIATIIYTSGTTGKPKGVILNHRNFLSTIEEHHRRYDFKSSDTSLAFLPLSHIFERAWTFLILSSGMTNVYNKNPKAIGEMMILVKPTAMSSVPRLYEKIYHLAMDTMSKSSAPVKKLFFWALKTGRKREELIRAKKPIGSYLAFKDKIAEKLVFKKFREKLGGNLNFMPCGGAYLDDEIVSFFRAMRLPIIVGYGLSETTATVSSGLVEEYKLGTVGKPLNNIEVRIGENDEIQIKGGNVMQGYYNDPEETAKVFTEDGWFKTGDAGKFDDEGYLMITDRIKDLIKTAGGKYIAPQFVEGVLTNDPLIDQAIVYGERKPYAVALIAPNFEILKNWANEQKINYNNLSNLVQNSSVVELFNKKIKELQAKLASYEQVKKFHILDRELSMKNGEITPTLKPVRKNIFEKYKEFLEDLYKNR